MRWMVPAVGSEATDGQYRERKAGCGGARVCPGINGRAKSLPLLAAILGLLALAACSSSAPSDDTAAADVYPSQPLADLFRASRNAPPAAQTSRPPIVSDSSAAVAGAATAGPALAAPPPTAPVAGTALVGVSPPGVAFARATPPGTALAVASTPGTAAAVAHQPAAAPPPGSPTAPAAVPAASASSDEYDAAASVYPSVAIFGPN